MKPARPAASCEEERIHKKRGNKMSKMTEVMKEFKAFILKGNIIDMAVGVIIGGAFSKIVTSLVNDILMPALGALTGGADFSTLKWVINPAVTDGAGNEIVAEAAIKYGSFLQNIFDFLIIGVCMFFMIKAVATISARVRHEEEKKEEPAPAGPTAEELLAEIRDLLKETKGTAD